jgi:hypothetical protein
MEISSLRESTMNSFELDIIDEKSRAGSEFLMRIVREMRRALVLEKAERKSRQNAEKINQQAIATKIGTSRHVINRELQGLENITARRIGEFFWAIGWEPQFEAKKPPAGQNCDFITPPAEPKGAPVLPQVSRPSSEALSSENILELLNKTEGAPVPVVQ